MAENAQLNVMVLSPERIIYEGKALSLILPGERGVFEVQAYHKRLLSRLLGGKVIVDGHAFPIRRGVAKVGLESTVVIVEEEH